MAQYKISHKLILKLKEWIDKEIKAGFLYRTEDPGTASIFVQEKKDGRIRLLVDLRN